MKSGDEHKTEGSAKEVKGRVEEAAGKATNDRELKNKGRKDQAKGHTQKAAGEIKDAIKK